MSDDIYIHCPVCSHSLVVQASLQGEEVDCPDCSHTFNVPEIREGVRPVLRSVRTRSQTIRFNAFRGISQDIEELHTGMQSLFRNGKNRVDELELLQQNVTLMDQQVGLLVQEREGQPPDEPTTTESDPAVDRWSRIAMALCLCTVLAALLCALFLFGPF